MKETKTIHSTREFEAAIRHHGKERYLLKLYIAGMTSRSKKSIVNIKKICEDHLQGRYQLQIIDIYQQPTLAQGEQIIAAPTLIKKLPLPLRKFIGDMANEEKLLVGLDLRPKQE